MLVGNRVAVGTKWDQILNWIHQSRPSVIGKALDVMNLDETACWFPIENFEIKSASLTDSTVIAETRLSVRLATFISRETDHGLTAFHFADVLGLDVFGSKQACDHAKNWRDDIIDQLQDIGIRFVVEFYVPASNSNLEEVDMLRPLNGIFSNINIPSVRLHGQLCVVQAYTPRERRKRNQSLF